MILIRAEKHIKMREKIYGFFPYKALDLVGTVGTRGKIRVKNLE